MPDEADRALASEERAGERISSVRAEVKRTDELHADMPIPRHTTTTSKGKYGIEKKTPSGRTFERISERYQEIVIMIVHKKK